MDGYQIPELPEALGPQERPGTGPTGLEGGFRVPVPSQSGGIVGGDGAPAPAKTWSGFSLSAHRGIFGGVGIRTGGSA